jgi:hypothetical protein
MLRTASGEKVIDDESEEAELSNANEAKKINTESSRIPSSESPRTQGHLAMMKGTKPFMGGGNKETIKSDSGSQSWLRRTFGW